MNKKKRMHINKISWRILLNEYQPWRGSFKPRWFNYLSFSFVDDRWSLLVDVQKKSPEKKNVCFIVDYIVKGRGKMSGGRDESVTVMMKEFYLVELSCSCSCRCFWVIYHVMQRKKTWRKLLVIMENWKTFGKIRVFLPSPMIWLWNFARLGFHIVHGVMVSETILLI